MAAQPAPERDSLSDAEYHRLSQAVLAAVERAADGWLQGDLADVDTHRAGGLLELSFPDGSKIVVNTQPPLQEIWLAARAGGYHYRHCGGRWLDTRSGQEFFADLSAQASRQAGVPLAVAPPAAA